MKFRLISCALLLAYTIGSILQYRNVDLSQVERSRTLLGNNGTHHPILAHCDDKIKSPRLAPQRK